MSNRKSKFKKGDKVICISDPEGGKGGVGWELGKTFIIGSISPFDSMFCYFPNIGGNGVWENALSLTIGDWDD